MMEPPEVQKYDFYQSIKRGWGNALQQDVQTAYLFYDISRREAGESHLYER
jgi:hypothetical protein